MRALSFSTVMWQTGSIAVAGFFREMSRRTMLTPFQGRTADRPRVRPLKGRDVGQDLAAVPAVFVAPLLERLGRQRAQPGGGLRSGGAERLDELGLGGRALRCHESACPKTFSHNGREVNCALQADGSCLTNRMKVLQ